MSRSQHPRSTPRSSHGARWPALLAVGAGLLTLALGAGTGYLAQSALQADTAAKSSQQAYVHLQTYLRGVNELLLTEGSSTSRKVVGQEQEAIDAKMSEMDSTMRLQENRETLEKVLHPEWARLRSQVQALQKLKGLSASDDDAMIAYGKVAAVSERIEGALSSLKTRATERSDHAFSMALTLGCGVAVALLLFIGAVGRWVLQLMYNRMGDRPAVVMQIAERLARHDLSQTISVAPAAQGTLLSALADIQAKLSGVVHEVQGNSSNLATAAEEIAAGNLDLSRRTEQQASALEKTTHAMAQLGATVQQNAANAIEARQLASTASAVAQRGDEVVGRVVDTMRGIEASSRKISEIIGVIDGIAFQTNILALNASVEAARAGEQGRGFAVVAGEVRNLAQRSATAAREIKTLISDSVGRVAEGAQLANSAGATMQDMQQSIRQVAEIVSTISHASAQQSEGVAELSQVVAEIDQATQQNAALAEENAAAVESLNSQAQRLVASVSVFRLGSQGSSDEPLTHRNASADHASEQHGGRGKAIGHYDALEPAVA